jgi:predicted nuclease with TOPRIM domain
MSSAIDSHLRDLENELRDADRDVEEYRERNQRRIEAMNNEIAELVKKVQFEKAAIKEQLDRKEQWAKRKFDEVHAFKVSSNCLKKVDIHQF